MHFKVRTSRTMWDRTLPWGCQCRQGLLAPSSAPHTPSFLQREACGERRRGRRAGLGHGHGPHTHGGGSPRAEGPGTAPGTAPATAPAPAAPRGQCQPRAPLLSGLCPRALGWGAPRVPAPGTALTAGGESLQKAVCIIQLVSPQCPLTQLH